MSLLVFGRSGQLATELGLAAPEATFLGREEADLSDPAACAAAIEAHAPSAVINAAAWTAVDAAETEEAAAHVVNAAAPGAMAAACAARAIPFLHVSTDYVFDGAGTAPWTEDAPTAPLGAYGRTKLAGEVAIAEAMEGRAPWAVLRTSWVVSAHGSNFVKTMLRLGAERDALRVVDDQVGAPTPAADLAAALLVMEGRMREPRPPSGLFHLASAPHVSWAGLAAHIMERAGLPCRIEPIPSSEFPTPAARPLNSRLSGARLHAAFGIGPINWQPSLDAILAQMNTPKEKI
ncbi:MAG: dTDP-4-dehydrorhamnose reductase [Pseudomonadota bacterium]